MALWTPYKQEAALDLSKTAVKMERTSPLLAATAGEHYHSPYMWGHHYPLNTDPQQYCEDQFQPVAFPVPIMYPESLGSSHAAPSMSSSQDLESRGSNSFDTESLSEDVEYQKFEQDAMCAMAEKNGGVLLGNNPRMRRAVQTSQAADDSYRKQRERNNIAAKQSRDRRKLREVRLALQVTYLKKKMVELKASLATGVCGRCRRSI